MVWSTKNRHKGFTLVEAVLSIAVLLLLGVGSVAANKVATSGIKINQYRSQANLLATEAMEALMNARAQNYQGLTTGVFHPFFDGVNWNMVAGAENLNGFTRSITLSPVMRALTCTNNICDIVSGGGIVDANTLKVEVKVVWTESGKTQNIVLNSLITYWR